jgi:Flp pilus assembly protein CpaB
MKNKTVIIAAVLAAISLAVFIAMKKASAQKATVADAGTPAHGMGLIV